MFHAFGCRRVRIRPAPAGSPCCSRFSVKLRETRAFGGNVRVEVAGEVLSAGLQSDFRGFQPTVDVDAFNENASETLTIWAWSVWPWACAALITPTRCRAVGHPPDVHRPRDILDRLLTTVLVTESKPSSVTTSKSIAPASLINSSPA